MIRPQASRPGKRPSRISTPQRSTSMSTGPKVKSQDRFNEALEHVLQVEGGFVNHPADKGGATKFGITRATLAAWRTRPVSVEDVQRMNREEAAAIYRKRYWDYMRLDAIEDASKC